MRAEFRRVLREDLPAYWDRIGKQTAPPSEPQSGAMEIVLSLPPKPKRRGHQ